jgi:hypothetical protein
LWEKERSLNPSIIYCEKSIEYVYLRVETQSNWKLYFVTTSTQIQLAC